MTEPPAAKPDRRAPGTLALAAVGVFTTAAFIAWLAQSTADGSSRLPAALWILLSSGAWAILWLTAAAGLGWPLRRLLVRDESSGATQIALGSAVLLLLDSALGRLGALQAFGGAGAWGVLAVGWLLLGDQLRRLRRSGPFAPARLTAGAWLALAATPAAAALLLAACSAPGWLWASEFGGYDALSYHLQLPLEWLAQGRVAGLEHNVYGFLPSYVESAYYHLAILEGGAVRAAYACQLLHAGVTLITAALVIRVAARLAGAIAGAIAGVVLLATPWVVVVGSLAYNEMFVALMLAGALDLLVGRGRSERVVRLGAAVGVLAGAACAAKLTAIGFAAIPIAGLLALRAGSLRATATAVTAAAVSGLVMLAPYLMGNLIATGNPVFPFLSGLLGLGHWQADQAAIFASGHGAGQGLSERAAAVWNELLRYGIGPRPAPGAPWLAQWSVLPWLTIAAALILARSPRRRLAGALGVVIALQLLFWLLLTHVKSRFMVPAVVPSALLVGVAAVEVRSRLRRVGPRPLAIGTAVLLIAYGWLSVAIYRSERGGAAADAVGAVDVFTGDAFASALAAGALTRAEVSAAAPMAYTVNHELDAETRVLGAGEATAFYYRPDRFVYATTWDRGPLSAALAEAGGDPAAFVAALRRRGFTHLLVNPTMLRIWQAEGWNDRLITADAALEAGERDARLVRRDPSGLLLFELSSR